VPIEEEECSGSHPLGACGALGVSVLFHGALELEERTVICNKNTRMFQ
jgi:hypothetical protein